MRSSTAVISSTVPYYEVGFVYTGIYVMGFCQWICRYVREHKIEKILFLAREGDLYQKVFHTMYPDIPAEYVLWSRIGVVKTIVEKNRHPYLLQIVHHKANALYKSKIGTLLERTGIGDLEKVSAGLPGKKQRSFSRRKMKKSSASFSLNTGKKSADVTAKIRS